MVGAQPVQQSKVKVFGRTGSPQGFAVRDFLYRNDVAFEWIELHTVDEARAIGVESVADDRLPVCVFDDGTRIDPDLE
jgi:thioredoxin reductase (NADPH)